MRVYLLPDKQAARDQGASADAEPSLWETFAFKVSSWPSGLRAQQPVPSLEHWRHSPFSFYWWQLPPALWTIHWTLCCPFEQCWPWTAPLALGLSHLGSTVHPDSSLAPTVPTHRFPRGCARLTLCFLCARPSPRSPTWSWGPGPGHGGVRLRPLLRNDAIGRCEVPMSSVDWGVQCWPGASCRRHLAVSARGHAPTAGPSHPRPGANQHRRPGGGGRSDRTIPSRGAGRKVAEGCGGARAPGTDPSSSQPGKPRTSASLSAMSPRPGSSTVIVLEAKNLKKMDVGLSGVREARKRLRCWAEPGLRLRLPQFHRSPKVSPGRGRSELPWTI